MKTMIIFFLFILFAKSRHFFIKRILQYRKWHRVLLSSYGHYPFLLSCSLSWSFNTCIASTCSMLNAHPTLGNGGGGTQIIRQQKAWCSSLLLVHSGAGDAVSRGMPGYEPLSGLHPKL
jgi:hypothetical protein